MQSSARREGERGREREREGERGRHTLEMTVIIYTQREDGWLSHLSIYPSAPPPTLLLFTFYLQTVLFFYSYLNLRLTDKYDCKGETSCPHMKCSEDFIYISIWCRYKYAFAFEVTPFIFNPICPLGFIEWLCWLQAYSRLDYPHMPLFSCRVKWRGSPPRGSPLHLWAP